MNTTETFTDTVQYSKKLFNAGVSGIRDAEEEALRGQTIPEVFAEAAKASLNVAVVGACVGLISSYFRRRESRASTALAYGLLGSSIGFCVGISWRSRNVAKTLAHSALKEMHRVSDEHWLESHPIDYA